MPFHFESQNGFIFEPHLKDSDSSCLVNDLELELKNDDSAIKDVYLVGSDGGQIHVTKAILAVRSPYFRKMFFGGFREAQRDDDTPISLNYPVAVLRTITTHCYTGKMDLGLLGKDADNFKVTDNFAKALVQLRDAANYLELTHLHKTSSTMLEDRLTTSFAGVECSCAILQELMNRGETEGPIWSIWMKRAHENLLRCLFPEDTQINAGVRGISFTLLTAILGFETDNLPAFTAVKAIMLWDEAHPCATPEEQVQLKELANIIDLESIASYNLAEIEPCRLFPQDRLYKAMVANLKTNKSSGFLFGGDSRDFSKQPTFQWPTTHD